MFSLMKSDIIAKSEWLYGDSSVQSIVKACVTDGSFSMLIYRLMQASQKNHLYPIAMILNKINALFGRCIIGRGADFGPAFVLIHSYGVIINSAVKGGHHIFLEHLVTIGAEKGQAPHLQDHVFIGAGAKVFGPITIGHRTKIGANSVVNCNIPDDATAVGVPARILSKKEQVPSKAIDTST